eukprot:TRINITY_DN3399_c1_g1_i3.p1 TRINITY_DN3399_c1_g1~~TRINITY_DN3399_c1_g1_i3.p1  ORF type:complete len:334 (-),score=56.51 TRINITY_DN3399_c1_g1_i3:189-1190(-)
MSAGVSKSNRDPTIQKQRVELSTMEHIVSSTIGGLFVAVFTTPLDVVKTRLQAQLQSASASTSALSPVAHQQVQLRGTIDAFVKIARHEGVPQLWRGLQPTLVLQVPATTLYFTAYEKFRRHTEWAGVFAPMLAGLSARSLTTFITSPLDMFRTNLQSHSRQVGSIDILRSLIRQGRVMSLWAGLTPTLYRDVPFSALYWTFYEFLKTEQQKRNRQGFAANFTSGAIAGGVSATITLPFDVVKTRMQMNVDTKAFLTSPSRVSELMRSIIRTEGVAGLFTGVLPRVAKVAPACAIMIGTYEWMKEAFVLRHISGVAAVLSSSVPTGAAEPPKK